MWEKAQNLLLDDSAIVRAPGSENAWMIKLQQWTSSLREIVRVWCDDQCLSYKSMKICPNSLALAITEKSLNSFLEWHHNQSHQPNFTALSEYGKSKAAGKKNHCDEESLRSKHNKLRM